MQLCTANNVKHTLQKRKSIATLNKCTIRNNQDTASPTTSTEHNNKTIAHNKKATAHIVLITAHSIKYTSHNEKRTVHTRRSSMELDIQRKVTVVAFHKIPCI